MPNWCSNTLKMTASSDQVDKLEAYLRRNEDDHGLLSYFVPEPLDLSDWYSWRCENWGTKWEVELNSLRRDGNTLAMTFSSAWAPPLGAYEAMHAQGWDIEACYWEPGMCFAGEWVNGQNKYLDYGTPEEVEEKLPLADRELGIADALKEWEED